MSPEATAREAKQQLTELIRRRGTRHVVAIGIGRRRDGQFVLRVRLDEDDHTTSLPPEVSGVPVEIQVIGPIKGL